MRTCCSDQYLNATFVCRSIVQYKLHCTHCTMHSNFQLSTRCKSRSPSGSWSLGECIPSWESCGWWRGKLAINMRQCHNSAIPHTFCAGEKSQLAATTCRRRLFSFRCSSSYKKSKASFNCSLQKLLSLYIPEEQSLVRTVVVRTYSGSTYTNLLQLWSCSNKHLIAG